jgi:hypothetical protein
MQSKKYIYSKQDKKVFKRLLKSVRIICHKGCKKNPCKILKKTKIRNPFHGIYPNQPKHLEPHRLAFAVKNGYLPEKDLSHACHQHQCVTNDHMVIESRSLNLSRNSCKRKLKTMYIAWIRSKRKKFKNGKIFLSSCKHGEHSLACFISVGKL